MIHAQSLNSFQTKFLEICRTLPGNINILSKPFVIVISFKAISIGDFNAIQCSKADGTKLRIIHFFKRPFIGRHLQYKLSIPNCSGTG